MIKDVSIQRKQLENRVGITNRRSFHSPGQCPKCMRTCDCNSGDEGGDNDGKRGGRLRLELGLGLHHGFRSQKLYEFWKEGCQ